MQKVSLFLSLISFFSSCKNLSKNEKETAIIGNDYNVNGLNTNYNWTGTYELKDDTVLYILKLHKRSVDGNYEMQFFSNDKNIDLYKSSIYDAKDDSANICIKFLNNFQFDAKPLGFNSGDTLFVFHLNLDKTTSTNFNAFKPKTKQTQFVKVSDAYN